MAGLNSLDMTDLSALTDQVLYDMRYTVHDSIIREEEVPSRGTTTNVLRRMTLIDGEYRSTKWIAKHFEMPLSTVNKRISRGHRLDVDGETMRLISLEIRRRGAAAVRESNADHRVQADTRFRQSFLSLPSHKDKWNYVGLAVDRSSRETA